MVKVLVDGEPATIVGAWSDFEERGFDLVMADGSKRWISEAGARVRMTAIDEGARNMASERERDLHAVRQAHSVRVMCCGNPECLRPHVFLYDEAGEAFAQFVVPDPKPDGGFLFDLQSALYGLSVQRDHSEGGDRTQ
jgi:hypothetical protein